MSHNLTNLIQLYKQFIVNSIDGKLQFIRGNLAFLKVGLYCLIGKTIPPTDYALEYDHTAESYALWTNRMGRYTDRIITLDHLHNRPQTTIQKPVEILDLACGQGYITKKLLELNKRKVKKLDLRMTCVDFSKKMLEGCRGTGNDPDMLPEIGLIHSDALEFLERSPLGVYDAIFFGWALPYVDHRKLIKNLYRVLAPGGKVHLITNCRGTLQHIEEIIIQTLVEHRRDLKLVFDIVFHLPSGEEGLNSWLEQGGFQAIRTGGGEELVYFDTPGALYEWLCKTGIIAGIRQFFSNLPAVEQSIIKKIALKRKFHNRYMINHRFIYGIYQKPACNGS